MSEFGHAATAARLHRDCGLECALPVAMEEYLKLNGTDVVSSGVNAHFSELNDEAISFVDTEAKLRHAVMLSFFNLEIIFQALMSFSFDNLNIIF